VNYYTVTPLSFDRWGSSETFEKLLKFLISDNVLRELLETDGLPKEVHP
jgi:hypothetical protein